MTTTTPDTPATTTAAIADTAATTTAAAAPETTPAADTTTITDTTTATEQIRNALTHAYDPCSQSWQRPLSLIDLGLIRHITVTPHGHATIRISLTAPFCMAVPTIMQTIEHKTRTIHGITHVTTEIDGTTPWHPDLMTPHGRQLLTHARTQNHPTTTHPQP
ncbi:iron-sulfur cluster assembly protein [Streptomyces sp. NPDC052225]|uniref:metal-sulfur cluster assembly factor n=1 Tax=Streptomyces sp. NPDC052225 TaxID=3154949 RepID=UPI003437AB78